jgi:SAM-dependent MidA family methyltransferase
MIPFSEYFNNWLYGDKGYYSEFREIGKKGDFFTAVSVSKFFGGTLAKRIISSIDEGFVSSDVQLVEIGAHHGYLMADIIEFIYTLRPSLLKSMSFSIVERYDSIKNRQNQYFKESFGDEIKLTHYKDISEIKADEVYFVSNEIFDAFSCEIVANDKMLYIDNHTLVWDKMSDKIAKKSKEYSVTKGEVGLYDEFALSLSKIKKFEFLSFDYGDKFPRGDISTRIYQAHGVHPLFEQQLDLAKLYQVSDITYDVNFELLIGEFEDVGIKLVEYKTQLSALIEFGLLDLLDILQKNVSFEVFSKEKEKIKNLIDPSSMGERFKMVRFRKE